MQPVKAALVSIQAQAGSLALVIYASRAWRFGDCPRLHVLCGQFFALVRGLSRKRSTPVFCKAFWAPVSRA